MTPSKEEFDAWREHYVTAWVLAGVKRYAEGQKAAWADKAWASVTADQAALDNAYIRADAYEGLAGLTYENAVGLHPETEQP